MNKIIQIIQIRFQKNKILRFQKYIDPSFLDNKITHNNH